MVADINVYHNVGSLSDLLDLRAGIYKAVIRTLQAKIVQNSSPEILSATFDLDAMSRAIMSLDESDMVRATAYYQELGHNGMVFVLVARSPSISPHTIAHTQLRQCRQRLLAEWPNTMDHFNLSASNSILDLQKLGIDLSKNQIFVPEVIWNVPSVRADVLADDRPDCLGRYPSRKLANKEFGIAGSKFVIKSDNSKIGVDILERDQWYLACCSDNYEGLRSLQEAVTDFPGTSPSVYASVPFAFHLTAARGDIDIFHMLRRAPTTIWDAVMRAVDEEDQTCLAVAAACGHQDLVDLICQACSLETLSHIWAHKVPLHTAVYNSHSVIVSTFIKLFKHLNPAALDYASPSRDLPSPFWYAVRSEDTFLMRLLAPYADINRECRGYTPFQLAVIEDSAQTLSCLLDLNCKEPNKGMININDPLEPDGLTLLNIAIKEEKQELIDILLTDGGRTGASS